MADQSPSESGPRTNSDGVAIGGSPQPPRPSLGARLGGAILFYTRLPLPRWWQPQFEGIAALAPTVGLGLGACLALADVGLAGLGIPSLTRSALVVGLWLWLTAGLHLDGAMDTADGLAVLDPRRRLTVMADSHTGAFGVMVAIAILGLKTVAVADLSQTGPWILVAAALWGRWGQLLAIARYPYLKAQGKGALHRQFLRLPHDLWLGTLPLLGFYGLWFGSWALSYPTASLSLGLLSFGGGAGLAWLTGYWLYRHLGGHTGDTYGAVVEWTEALVLGLATIL